MPLDIKAEKGVLVHDVVPNGHVQAVVLENHPCHKDAGRRGKHVCTGQQQHHAHKGQGKPHEAL